MQTHYIKETHFLEINHLVTGIPHIVQIVPRSVYARWSSSLYIKFLYGRTTLDEVKRQRKLELLTEIYFVQGKHLQVAKSHSKGLVKTTSSQQLTDVTPKVKHLNFAQISETLNHIAFHILLRSCR
uniref:Uncharacterized protein n=1 Tax=Opuntia streptacantha TaxID=393608 RepID=A0A7C9DL91_OPUST